jgi:hypothetical protein
MRALASACVIVVGLAAYALADPAPDAPAADPAPAEPAAPAAEPPADAPPAAPPAGHLRLLSTQVEIDDQSTAPTRLPYELDADWRLIKVEAIDVAMGGRRDKDLLGAISAIKHDTAGIDLYITRSGLRWAGTYQVVLQVTLRQVPKPPPPKPAAGAGSAGSGAGSAAPAPPPLLTERTPITVVKAAAVLADAPAVAVKLTSFGLWESRTVTPLLLDETSNRGELTGLKITQQGVVIHDSSPTEVRLKAAVDPPTIHPGEQRDLVIDWQHDLPWGTSTGNLRVQADQLAKPITVAVTIEHTRWSGFIALVFLAGGLLGLLIRRWSKDATDRLKLREDGTAVIATLSELLTRSLPAERKQLTEARQQIVTTAAGRDEAALKAAITAGSELSTKVATTHGTQLETERALLARYAAVGDLALARQLGFEAASREAIASIEDALLDHDVARADRNLTALAAKLELRRPALDAWIARLTAATDRLLVGADRAPVLLRDPLSKVSIEPIRTAYKTKKLLLDVAEATHDPMSTLDEGIDQARRALSRLANELTAILSNAPTLATDLARAATFGDGDLPARIDQLAAALATWFTELDRAIARSLSSQEPKIVADATAAKAALDAGDYKAACEKLNPLAQRASGGDAPEVPTVDEPAARARDTDAAPTVLADVSAPGDAALVSVGLRRRATWARVVQALVAYAILPFGAWVAWHDGFVGRIPELIAIGATGFLTDFSAEAALAKLETLKK